MRSTREVTPDLTLLRNAMAHEAWDEALARALDIWRHAGRPPDLVPLVMHLSDQALASFVAPKVRTRVGFHEAWRRLAGQDTSAVATGFLAATLTSKVPEVDPPGGNYAERDFARVRYQALLERVEILMARTPDPRLARAAFAVLERGRLGAWDPPQARDVYGPLVRLLESAGDVSLLPALQRLALRPPSRRALVRAVLTEDLPATIARLEQVVPATLDLGNLSEAVPTASDSQKGGVDVDALIRHVRSDPDDEGLREVLGDAFLERGGPHAEVVALERSGAMPDDKRMVRLVRRHARVLMGPDLAAVLLKPMFRGGLLERATVRATQAAAREVWDRAPQAPELATLRVLRKGRASSARYRSLVQSPRAARLRSIDIDTSDFVAMLVDGPPRPLESVRFVGLPDHEDLVRLAQAPGLSNLHALDVPCLHPLTLTTLRGVWRVRLQELGVAPGVDYLGYYGEPMFGQIEVFGRWFPNLRRLVVHDEYNVSPVFERRDAGWILQLRLPSNPDRHVFVDHGNVYSVHSEAPDLASLPPQVVEVRLSGHASAAIARTLADRWDVPVTLA